MSLYTQEDRSEIASGQEMIAMIDSTCITRLRCECKSADMNKIVDGPK